MSTTIAASVSTTPAEPSLNPFPPPPVLEVDVNDVDADGLLPADAPLDVYPGQPVWAVIEDGQELADAVVVRVAPDYGLAYLDVKWSSLRAAVSLDGFTVGLGGASGSQQSAWQVSPS